MTIKHTEELKKEIRKLYQEGWKNGELSKRFKINPSGITYIVLPGQKEKSSSRQQKYRTIFKRVISQFVQSSYIKKEEVECKRPERRFYFVLRSFFKDKKGNTKGVDMKSTEEIARKVLWPHDGKDHNGNEYPYVSCAITGRRGSIMVENKNPDRISPDHIIPKSKGGSNDLKTNMQPLLQSVNEMKKEHLDGDFFTIIKWIVDGPKFKEWEKKLDGTGG